MVVLPAEFDGTAPDSLVSYHSVVGCAPHSHTRLLIWKVVVAVPDGAVLDCLVDNSDVVIVPRPDDTFCMLWYWARRPDDARCLVGGSAVLERRTTVPCDIRVIILHNAKLVRTLAWRCGHNNARLVRWYRTVQLSRLYCEMNEKIYDLMSEILQAAAKSAVMTVSSAADRAL